MTKTKSQKLRAALSKTIPADQALSVKKQPSQGSLRQRLTQAANARAGFNPGMGRITGKGDYGDGWKEDLSNAASKGFSKLGNWLTKSALSLFGLGDYASHEQNGTLHLDDTKIQTNTLLAGTSPPVLENKGQAFVMRHREYVGDVNPSVEFTNNPYLINPGNASLFPWLSAIVQGFEEYQINGMVVEYKPLVSAVSANSIGAVVLSTEYNPTKPPFVSKVEMENYEYATSCAPHHSMMHAIECKPQLTTVPHKQIIYGEVPPDQDPRMYYWGNLQVATQGQSNAVGVIGELWLTYEILCFKPIYSVGRGLSIFGDRYEYPLKRGLNNMCAPDSGTDVTPYRGTIGTFISPDGVIYFPPGTVGHFLISHTYTANPTASNTVITGPTHVGFSQNCELVPYFLSQIGARTEEMPTGGIVIVSGMVSGGFDYVLSVAAPTTAPAGWGLLTISNFNAGDIMYHDLTITQINSKLTAPPTTSTGWRAQITSTLENSKPLTAVCETIAPNNKPPLTLCQTIDTPLVQRKLHFK